MKMRIYSCLSLFVTVLFFGNSCQTKREGKVYRVEERLVRDTVYLSMPRRDWQKDFGLSHNPNEDTILGNPASMYLNNVHCSGLAKAFYYGQYKPTDDFITPELLNLALTEQDSLRPFYLWCLSKTILISDGALGEYIGSPARAFIEQYPKAFFELMDKENSPQLYNKWVSGIRYSGLLDFYYTDKRFSRSEIQQILEKEMLKNCVSCSAQIKQRISRLTKDIVAVE